MPGPYRPPDEMARLTDEICDWLRSGKSVSAYCRQEGKPEHKTIALWREKFPEFAAEFSEARRSGCHVIADEALEIIDTEPGRVMPSGGYDSAEITWRQHRFSARLKLLASWNRFEYGDKTQTEISGPNGGPVEFTTIAIKAVDP